MKEFFEHAGWIVLGVFCLVVAAVLGYYGFVNLAKSSWGWAVASLAGATVFLALTVSAFRQSNK
jgi:uncharacterized membrane protein